MCLCTGLRFYRSRSRVFLHLGARYSTKGERLRDVTFPATAEVSTGRVLLAQIWGAVLTIGTREVSQ